MHVKKIEIIERITDANGSVSENILTSWNHKNYFLPEMLQGNFNAATTDREAAIMFGITPRLIEGVLVGRKIENDKQALSYINSKLPDCYICNLDGIVIK